MLVKRFVYKKNVSKTELTNFALKISKFKKRIETLIINILLKKIYLFFKKKRLLNYQ